MVCFTHKLNVNSLFVLFSKALAKYMALIIHVQAARCALLSHPKRESFTFNANKYNIKLIHFPICFGF